MASFITSLEFICHRLTNGQMYNKRLLSMQPFSHFYMVRFTFKCILTLVLFPLSSYRYLKILDLLKKNFTVIMHNSIVHNYVILSDALALVLFIVLLQILPKMSSCIEERLTGIQNADTNTSFLSQIIIFEGYEQKLNRTLFHTS